MVDVPAISRDTYSFTELDHPPLNDTNRTQHLNVQYTHARRHCFTKVYLQTAPNLGRKTGQYLVKLVLIFFGGVKKIIHVWSHLTPKYKKVGGIW